MYLYYHKMLCSKVHKKKKQQNIFTFSRIEIIRVFKFVSIGCHHNTFAK